MAPVQTGLVDKASNLTKAAFGMGSPGGQMVAAFLLGVAIIATSSIGLVFTLLLLPIPIVLFFIGAVRLLPPVEAVWPLT